MVCPPLLSPLRRDPQDGCCSRAPSLPERSGAHRILSIVTHGHQPDGHGPEGMLVTSEPQQKKSDVESVGTDHDRHSDDGTTTSPIATILGVAILEFGVALHRYVLELSTREMQLSNDVIPVSWLD